MEKCSKDRFSSNPPLPEDSELSGPSHGALSACFDPAGFSDPAPFGDPELAPFSRIIRERALHALNLERRITRDFNVNDFRRNNPEKERRITWDLNGPLYHFADYHLTFGLFQTVDGWLFREWAPNATQIILLSPMTDWQPHPSMALTKMSDEIFEGRFPPSTFAHKALYRLKVYWEGGEGDRIPTGARRVVQDPHTLIFNAQVWEPPSPFHWTYTPSKKATPSSKEAPCEKQTPLLNNTLSSDHTSSEKRTPSPPSGSPGNPWKPLLIYEAHVGMALEERRVGTYREFQEHILPKIKDAGYTAIQLMAIPEHPYYASFGYHVSSFFAPSSRFGTPDDLKSLIDTAHGMGLLVFMDIVHSHSVRNEVEGLSRFDGRLDQFFHPGSRGHHRLWDSRCFNYGALPVVRFLLSNLRYWQEAFHVDGFRFDGITSMLFLDHGLERSFTGYGDYFGPDIDPDALSYLTLANRLIHELDPKAVTIAEDVSGYPGLAAPIREGGAGFDYRFAMGIADHWIKLVKDTRDEDWEMGRLWYELTTRRKEEKTLSYAECHDQALVGDQTLMMRLMGDLIYTAMDRQNRSIETVRAVALHKMIRLITMATAHAGYLNFMGNEFGHPEWIDFPSERNGFSFDHARRQWSLKDNPDLQYSALSAFDREMIALAKEEGLFSCSTMHPARPADHRHLDVSAPTLLTLHEADKIIAFERNGLIFVFNFHPITSFTDYPVDAPPGKYALILDTDEARFGGSERLRRGQEHFTVPRSQTQIETVEKQGHYLRLYLPSRCALVLSRLD